MSLTGALNTRPVNGEVPINSGTRVTYISSGEIVSFEQDVELRSVSSGTIANVEQVVASVSSGSIADIQQSVITQAVAGDHISRTGWDITLWIGGREIPRDEISGQVSVRLEEDTAKLLTVTLLPDAGVQNVSFYAGKTVTLDVRISSGTYRVFTGVVDIPEVDFYRKTITLQCTDRRTELINSTLENVVDNIGVYSDLIFKSDESVADRLESRLSTIPYSLDFDGYGNYRLTKWAAKATADYTFTDSDVYGQGNRDPSLEMINRGRVINKINIDVNYRYSRLHHLEKSFRWTSPIATDYTLLFVNGYSLTPRSMILAAVDAAGWPLKGDVSWTDDIPATGSYTVGSGIEQVTIIWSTAQRQGNLVPKRGAPTLDEFGQVVQEGQILTDAQGNVIYEDTVGNPTVTEYKDLYTLGAQWTGTTRWAQTITEEYSLVVQAPQSQTQYGDVEQDLQYGLQSDYDESDWEDYDEYDNQGSGTYFLDKDTNRNAFNQAVNVLLNKAKTTILGSHRDTRATITTSIKPFLGTYHTVNINTTPVSAKGKVVEIEHVFNHETTEAYTVTTIALSQSEGSTTDSALSIPTTNSVTPTFGSGIVRLGNHYGEDPTQNKAASWTGFIGNAYLKDAIFRTEYTEQFRVDTPDIPNSARDEQILTASATYNVLIPNDTLTVTF